MVLYNGNKQDACVVEPERFELHPHRPHVAQYVEKLAAPLVSKYGRDWCLTRLASVLPMHLYSMQLSTHRYRLIELYDHLRAEIAGFGGQADYDLIEELVNQVFRDYGRDLAQWELATGRSVAAGPCSSLGAMDRPAAGE